MGDPVGTSTFVAADSEAEALRRAEAKYAGRNPRATRAIRSGDGHGWTVSVTVDRPETVPGAWDALEEPRR